VVNVQVKNKNFETYSHQRKMTIPTDSTKIIYEEAKTRTYTSDALSFPTMITANFGFIPFCFNISTSSFNF